MVLLIIIPMKNGYFIGGIPHFQTYPYSISSHLHNELQIDIVCTSNQIDIGWLGDLPATDFRDVRYSGMTPQMHALTKAGMIILWRAPVSIS